MLLDYFEKVFVISLAHRDDRRKVLKSTFQELGLIDPEQVEWVRAVDGRLCPAPDYFKAGSGAWGCYQTHLRIAQDAAMDGLESYLVIEDDAIFSPNSEFLLRKFMEQVPDDWQQIFLGGQHLDTPEDVPYRPMVMEGRNVTRTHAFALRNTGYNLFQQHIANAADYLANGGWHVDHQIGAAHQKSLWKTYVPSWWISGQGPGDSNIAHQINPPLWWHPSRYACQLPLVHYAGDKEGCSDLQNWIHFGNSLLGTGCVDEGLVECVRDSQKLKEWLETIADEALTMGKLPGICHPEILLESVAEIWGRWVIDSSKANLPKMTDYPFNGLFRHPVNRMRERPMEEFIRG
jgi:hypothetical protein